MAFIPAPNTAKVELIYTVAESECVNVFHVEKASPFDETALNDLAVFFADWFDDELSNNVSSAVSLTKIRATALDTQFSPGIEYDVTPDMTGSNTSPILPKNVTLAVKWLTGLRGRSYRGRTYIVGMTEDMVTGDNVSAAVAAAFQADFTALLTRLAVESMDLVVLSKFQGNAPRVTAVTTPITSCVVDDTVDSQRRRLKGRGR